MRFVTSDPRSGGLDGTIGEIVRYVSGGVSVALRKHASASTAWCTVPRGSSDEYVTADPRSSGLDRVVNTRVVYVSGGVGLPLIKYGGGTTEWATDGSATEFLRADGTSTAPSGASVADGDKGDITVSGGGATWNIDAGVVTTTELGGDITTAGKALLDDADAAAQRTTLGLGTAATQASSAFDAAGTAAGLLATHEADTTTHGISAFGATLVDDADAATARGTLGVVTPKRCVGVVFDGGGSTPTVGSVAYVVCPFAGTIDQWHIVADQSGSAVVDVWLASGIPTDPDTIAGTEKPTLSAAQIASDTSLSTWTTAVTAGKTFGFQLESVTTCTRITVTVRIIEEA